MTADPSKWAAQIQRIRANVRATAHATPPEAQERYERTTEPAETQLGPEREHVKGSE